MRHAETQDAVPCPTHRCPMKRLRIIWGPVETPFAENVIYGGCRVQTDEEGNELRFGYVCPACEEQAERHPNEEVVFQYVFLDGRIQPLG